MGPTPGRRSKRATLRTSKVRVRFNKFVDAVARDRDQLTITENGVPAAVLVGVDEWEARQATLFWLSQPDNRDGIAQARKELANGEGLTKEQIRAEFGVPKRSA